MGDSSWSFADRRSFGSQTDSSGDDLQWFSSVLDIVFGALLLAYVLVTLVRKPQTVARDVEEIEIDVERDLAKVTATFFLGMGVMAINLPFWAFAIPIFKDTSVYGLSGAEQFLFVVFVLLCAGIPGEIPILLYRSNPERAMRRLNGLNNWVKQHERIIIVIVGSLLGAWLLSTGIADIPS